MAAELDQWGTVLVVAPHQDDESLGCGGTIALLRQANVPVHVVFVSDGSMSHPNSQKFPMGRLIELREQEAIKALALLSVNEGELSFMRLKDSMVPSKGTTGYESAVDKFSDILYTIKPQTILVPWQRDPHQDHCAAWQITDEAIRRVEKPVRTLEYLIWLWERAAAEELPKPGERKVWQVDISKTLDLKREAIAAHVSQTTNLIDDDPEGFTLSTEVLNHFDRPTEIFVEQY